MIQLSLPLQRESANHQFPFFMLILLDPGHGLNTLGKRSPDGKFLEAIYNRDIAKRIVAELTILTTILTGKKTSICSEKLYAWQYSARIILWITNLILSICRAELESRLLSTLTLKASRNI